MNYLRFRELFTEFSDYVEQLHTLYLDSIVGYSILHERLQDYQEHMRLVLGESELASEEFQDTCSMIYAHLSSKDVTPVALSPVMKQGDMKQRLKDDGFNTILLGRQCVVSAYAFWEEHLRIEVGKALGVLGSDAQPGEQATRDVLNSYVTSDFWGDLRHLRNSIVHAKGIANSDTARCKLLTWFMPGDSIDLTHAQMTTIFKYMGMYRNALSAASYEKTTIRIPSLRHSDG